VVHMNPHQRALVLCLLRYASSHWLHRVGREDMPTCNLMHPSRTCRTECLAGMHSKVCQHSSQAMLYVLRQVKVIPGRQQMVCYSRHHASQ
jgi:hypothetical protein